MSVSKEIEGARKAAYKERAEMQKLSITGHLLPGADISAPHITKFLNELGPVCGMNIFNGPHVKTPDSYDQDTFSRLGGKAPEDVNGSLMWDDSGAQMYVFPKKGNWFTLDIYTCRTLDRQKALEYTYEQLSPGEDMKHSSSTSEKNTPWQPFVLEGNKPLNSEKPFVSKIDSLFNVDFSKKDNLFKAGFAFENLVAKAIKDGCGERLAASYTPKEKVELREIHSKFEIAVDNNFMDDVLSDKTIDAQAYPFQTRYDRLSEMEAQATGMQKGKPVMHIGTGWPGTAIGLYQQFGIPVTCVEINVEVAKKSKMALEKLKLFGEDKLQVVLEDGCNINPQEYSAVILSAMLPVEDKTRIMDNMKNLASGEKSDPLLILRTPPDRARSLFYQELPATLTNRPELKLIVDTGSLVSNDDHLKSLVYKIREMAEIRRGSDRIVMNKSRKLSPANALR
jgi:hypothetical protein